MPLGICINITHSCSKAINYDIQESDYGPDFVCVECGQPLCPYSNVEQTRPHCKRKFLIIISAALVTAAIAAGIFYYTQNDTATLIATKTTVHPVVDTPSELSEINSVVQKPGKTDTPTDDEPSVPSESNPIIQQPDPVTNENENETEAMSQVTTPSLKQNDSVEASRTSRLRTDNPIKSQNEPKPAQGRQVFGGKASLYDGVITFEKAYRLNLRTRDGEILQLSPGDRIIDPIIRNDRLRAGNFILKNGKQKRYISGLDNPI